MNQHAAGLPVFHSFAMAAVRNRLISSASPGLSMVCSSLSGGIQTWVRDQAASLIFGLIGALRRFLVMRRADSLPARSDGDDAIAGAEPTGGLGRTYRKGEIILQQGEKGDAMFVIQAGSVELVREGDGLELCIAELAEGEFFGENALFEQNIRTTTVRAVSEVRLITVDRRLLLRKIHEDASLAFRIMNCMARRITQLSGECMYLSRARLEAAMLHLEQGSNH